MTAFKYEIIEELVILSKNAKFFLFLNTYILVRVVNQVNTLKLFQARLINEQSHLYK